MPAPHHGRSGHSDIYSLSPVMPLFCIRRNAASARYGLRTHGPASRTSARPVALSKKPSRCDHGCLLCSPAHQENRTRSDVKPGAKPKTNCRRSSTVANPSVLTPAEGVRVARARAGHQKPLCRRTLHGRAHGRSPGAGSRRLRRSTRPPSGPEHPSDADGSHSRSPNTLPARPR